MFEKIFTIMLIFCCRMPGQATFEVASVKPAPPPDGPGIRVMMNEDAGRVTYSNVSMMNLLTRAYKVKEHQISGPDWLRNTRFDVTAKLPGGADKKQIPEMLQALLAERFKLAVHMEEKVAPVYAMTVAKGGPKIKPADQDSGMQVNMGPKGRKLNGKFPLSNLADMLSNSMDRVVVDMTGLTGPYDVTLEWTPDGGEGLISKGDNGAKDSLDSLDAPTISTALQDQLGLRLDSKKMPINVVTIDRIEKVPTDN